MFAGVLFTCAERQVLESNDITNVPKWFTGATLNYAENLLAKGQSAQKALVFARMLYTFTITIVM